MNLYSDDFPPQQQFVQLPELNPDEIRKTAQKMKGRSPGPDGWSPEMIAELPADALQRLCEMLQTCEAQQKWPGPLTHWAVKFIPKKRQGALPGLQDVRPISIGAIIYRIWASLRLQHVQATLKHLKQVFDRHQVLDVYDCVMSFHQEYISDEYPYGLCLTLLGVLTAWTLSCARACPVS